LVGDGVINQSQADAVAEALQAKAEELREERRQWFEDHPDQRRRHFGGAFRLGALLEDGVIDAEELAELGPDHPFNDPDGPAADYLDDGQLTAEEVREIIKELREQHRAGRDANGDGA
jgi:polyhydroxyalkanoate synthesis regulator phasin